MMIAMSPDLKIVGGVKGGEPDQELLEQKLMHPSRITEFGTSTGLAIMSKDNEPRVSFVAYLLVILIGVLVYGAYQYGHSNGRITGKSGTVCASLMEMRTA